MRRTRGIAGWGRAPTSLRWLPLSPSSSVLDLCATSGSGRRLMAFRMAGVTGSHPSSLVESVCLCCLFVVVVVVFCFVRGSLSVCVCVYIDACVKYNTC